MNFEPRSRTARAPAVGRYDPCPCGSGRKYKFCCGAAGAPARRNASPPPVPAAAQSALAAAAKLLRAGRHQEAIAPLEEAARLVPSNPSVLGDLGLALLSCRRLPEAIAWLRRSLALRPNFARAQLNLGSALEQTGDDEAAFAAFRRATALDPKLAEAHGRMGELLRAKGRQREAAEAFDRAYSVAAGTTFGRLCRAKALSAGGRPEEAAEWLRRLLASDRSSAEAHRLLGNLFAESGDFDQAAECFERSIELAPGQAGAYHGLAMSRRLTEADRPLVARMLSRLDDGDIADADRMSLHFAVGKALDDLGDYAGAIRHFDAANQIRHRSSRFDRREFGRRVDRLIARFTPEFFAGHAALGRDDELPVLVVGMPRSGTTLVERILSSHSRVGGGGELDFWNEHAPGLVAAESGRLAAAAHGLHADYRRLLRGIAPGALRVTDKMPFNFLWLGLVHLVFPNARVIHCRRNPVDTCLSIYTNHFATRWEFAGDRGELTFYYREYVRLMDHWRRALPADRLTEVDYEEVTGDTEAAARRLIAFLGMDWDERCLRPESNPEPVKTASLWQARQPVYRRSVERWRHYEPWLGELRQLLEG